MKRLLKIAKLLPNRISPEVAEHLQHLFTETYVAFVHKGESRRCFKKHETSRNIKVNFGCGQATKNGFVNLDFSPAADFRMDLRKNIPLPDSCCSLAYSEHFVEHLSYPEGVERFYSECFRILKPDGELSISVPDTEWPLREYANGADSYLKACEQHAWHPSECTTFMEHINYHFRQRWRNRSYGHFENHRFAWDFETKRKKLAELGFVGIAKREFDPNLDSGHRRVGSLFVTAFKPRSPVGQD